MASKKIAFTKIRVVPHFGTTEVGGFDVYWDVSVTGFTPKFTVEFADAIEGPWTPVSDDKTLDLFLLSCGDKVLVFDVVRWFRVKAWDGNILIETSSPQDHRNRLNNRDYLYYRDLLRRWRLQLTKFVGNPGYLIRRKVFGEICKVCTSEILNQPMSSECLSCYGTGITGGYLPAVGMGAVWEVGGPARTGNTTLEASGPSQVAQAQILIFPVPDAKGQDVWMDDGTGYRYIIDKLNPQQGDDYRGSLVRQRLLISRLPPKHPIYNFPV